MQVKNLTVLDPNTNETSTTYKQLKTETAIFTVGIDSLRYTVQTFKRVVHKEM